MDQGFIENLRVIFDFLDKDKSGSLSEDEFKTGLSILKINVIESQFYSIMKYADLNNDGKISFEEFTRLCYLGATKDRIKAEELLIKLLPYDKNNDGKISIKDLRDLLSGEGDPLADEDIDEIIQTFKKDDEEKILMSDMIIKFLS